MGRKFSPSVRKYTSRWYTRPDRNVMAEAWVTEGYKLFKVDLEREKATFHRARDGVSHIKIPERLTAERIPDEARQEVENFFQYLKKKYGL